MSPTIGFLLLGIALRLARSSPAWPAFAQLPAAALRRRVRLILLLAGLGRYGWLGKITFVSLLPSQEPGA